MMPLPLYTRNARRSALFRVIQTRVKREVDHPRVSYYRTPPARPRATTRQKRKSSSSLDELFGKGGAVEL
jgi:hypothetical protein